MEFSFEINGGDFSNAGMISSLVKKTLKQLNIDGMIIRRTVVALYEAEVNIVAHAYSGVVNVNIFPDKIKIKLTDKGTGIADIDLAMQQGYSTASPAVREMGFGAGMGLPNIKNNTDELNLESTVGVGTMLEFTNFFEPK
ncbi:MAG: anti-sigma regulatory factor [Bacteroidales bacterium]|nr:anti-sigma regulatory factor [Bacteroidales bacterium]MDD4574946.1 anti-sigma regulatory factor [Bacteroidales bacterium]